MGDKQRQVGDKYKIMRAKHPERRGKQGEASGDTCKIMRVKHPELAGRQAEASGRHVKNHAGRASRACWETSGDKWETNVKSCG